PAAPLAGAPAPAPTAPPPAPALVPTPGRAPREVAQVSPPVINRLLPGLTSSNPPSATTDKSTISVVGINFLRFIIGMAASSRSFFRLFRPNGSRYRTEGDLFGLGGNHKREQALLQLGCSVPFGKQGGDLQPFGFLIRDEELAGQRGWAIFDPDLPIDLLLSESQVMAQLTLHLAQPQIKAGQRPLHEIVIGIRIDQVCQGRSEIVRLDGMVQGGVNLRGDVDGAVHIFAEIHERDGLSIVATLPVAQLSQESAPHPV